ncbi:hypothetical protein MMSR116_22430 [Methylobacterium mesophilicum SR1.6/6]|uniref:Uncharacterized protein n=1 Tax=Methylobacterium mesophilicum SR1.6/6 TaxID=908290 RepID=A0A6B9FP04_9HYPH|nr:hypothetical protein MMSR116_22430 [Methylobacterium mesophilicum SR1.6/6]
MHNAFHPCPHPEAPERSEGLEGGFQPAARSVDPSFEAAAPHLRMRGSGRMPNRGQELTA